MPVPNTFGTATSAIPLSQLDANFATPITIGNTAVQLGNTVTTLNNMTLANVTISSGTITITNVSVTTANVSGTANVSTLVVVGNETVGGNTTITGNITAANANVTSNLVLFGGTANGVAYLNTSKQVTTGSALVFDGTSLGVGQATPNIIGFSRTITLNNATGAVASEYAIGGATQGWFGSSAAQTQLGSITNIPVVFYTNNTEGMRLTSTSLYIASAINVGIGLSNPTSKLHVKGTDVKLTFETNTGASSYIQQLSAAPYNVSFFNQNAGSLIFGTNDTPKMYLDSSGNLGLGVTPSAWAATNPIKAIQVGRGGSISYGNDSASTNIVAGAYLSATGQWTKIGTVASAKLALSDYDGSFVWSRAASGSGNFTYTDVMTLDASGNLLVGTTSSNALSNNDGMLIGSKDIIYKHADGTSSGAYYAGFIYNTSIIGSISQNGTANVAYSTSSDYRLKNSISPMIGALAKIALLKPCTYKWNSDGSDGQGFIAHELAEVCPDAVIGEKDAVNDDGSIKSQGIDTSFLVATLTAAIQELNAKFEEYKAAHP